MHRHQAKYTNVINVKIVPFAFFVPAVIHFSSFCSQAHYDVQAICVVAACQRIAVSLRESRLYSV